MVRKGLPKGMLTNSTVPHQKKKMSSKEKEYLPGVHEKKGSNNSNVWST
jgi:hypothetical protein